MLIDFESNSVDELTVKEGDVVKNVTKASEEGWLHGELRGNKGIFPANFVQVCQGFTVHSTVLFAMDIFVFIYIACNMFKI